MVASSVALIVLAGCGSFLFPEDTDLQCCVPFCKNTKEVECIEIHGGTWAGTSCEEVDECAEGCCTPQCVEGTKMECDMFGGSWTKGSCDVVDECQQGCCLPFCTELSKAECPMQGGEWNEESCASLDECKQGCCEPFCEDMIKRECDDRQGDFKKERCAGYSGSFMTEDTRSVYDIGKVHYRFGYDISNCSEKVESNWKGSVDWLWEFTGPGGAPQTTHEVYDVDFSVGPSGNFGFNLGGFDFTGNVTGENASITVDMKDFIGDVSASGSLEKKTSENFNN